MFEIEAHYARTGMLDGWTVPRVRVLCRSLGCTIFELGKLCALDFGLMNTYIKKERFPATVCLHFANLEAMLFRATTACPSRAVMPVHLFDKKGK